MPAKKNKSVRSCRPAELAVVVEIINDAARAYQGVIPPDCWRDPYMPPAELKAQVDAGVVFWGMEHDGKLAGVMGTQLVQDVMLIRHAYVRTAFHNRGIGSQLLEHLHALAPGPVLIGAWAAATRAIAFYEQHGFRQVIPSEKDRLLKKYWSIPERQVETSVVLADDRWFETEPSKVH
ncbi:MAG: GNAT family N-acetyltransferase [Verrucomicrobiia bacterium]